MYLLANALKVAKRWVPMFRTHLPAIVLAIVIGIATGAPQLFVVHQMGPAYKGVFPITSDDDRYYEARSQEVRDGFPHLGNPYILELRNEQGVSFWMPDAATSYSGEFFGLDVQHTFVLFDFIIPPILFLLTYLILFSITGSAIIALTSSAFFHLGFFLDTFSRSPSPQFNFLFVELAVFSAIRLVQGARYSVYCLALSLGSLFYVYPYFWTFAFGMFGTFFLATLLRKDLRPLSEPLFYALSGGVLLGSPVLFQMLKSGQSEAYRETILRLGMIFTHTPTGLGILSLCGSALLTYGFAAFFYPSFRNDRLFWFFVSTLLGGILASNNQIISGQNLEFSSHYFLPAAYITLLAGSFLIFTILSEKKNTAWAIPTRLGIVGILMVVILIKCATSVERRIILSPEKLSEQRYGPIMSWLRENTAPESVVLAAEDTSYLIAAYTPDRIFYSRNANLHIMTDEEAWTRFYLLYYGAKYDDDFFTNHVGQIWGAHYFDEYGHEMQLNKFRKLIGLPLVPAEVIPQAAKDSFKKFAASLSEKNPNLILGNRKIDYVISEPGFIIPGWMHDSYPTMHSVYVNSAFTIFALGPRKQ